MPKPDTRSKVEIVIDMILEGGYAEAELQDIIDTCEDELTRLEEEDR